MEPKGARNHGERVTGERPPRAAKTEQSSVRRSISFYENGELQVYEIPAEFGSVAKGLEAEPLNTLLRVGAPSPPPRSKRAPSSTTWPIFLST